MFDRKLCLENVGSCFRTLMFGFNELCWYFLANVSVSWKMLVCFGVW